MRFKDFNIGQYLTIKILMVYRKMIVSKYNFNHKKNKNNV